ncbi:MAG: DUF1800 domain-containing protein [Rubrivivax sp.]
MCAGLLLQACGGGGGSDAQSPSGSGTGSLQATEKPSSRDAAARFLTQATFGPTEAGVDRLMAIGYGPWIDEQLALPASSHRASWEAADAAIKAKNSSSSAYQSEFLQSFWKQAITGEDQLRQRMAYALSQIFVISMTNDTVGNNPRAVSAWLDMLGRQGMRNYRDLLEAVSLHPLMGAYLSHMRNQKAEPRTGRVPDENYAREVMQLFSIGLVELTADGSVRAAGGKPIETYGTEDVAGLAKVFTGFSWSCPEWPDNSCFFWGSANNQSDPDRQFNSMLGYPQYHAAEAKNFLGTSLPAQSRADPDASLKAALDTLFNHPNVGPFIGRQLIQRFVTSNPSPLYLAAVSAAFNGTGTGVRGDLRAVMKAVLMHPEARLVSNTSGKVREPVLRLSAFLRAFNFASDSGAFRVNNTDSASDSLGQTPLRAPSVFNFYRPGYVAPGTEAAAFGLVTPELQIAHETTAAGYVNYMRDNIAYGAGDWNDVTRRRDLQADWSGELALAEQPDELLKRINQKLMYGAMPADLKTQIVAAVEAIVIPPLNSKASNQKQIDDARRARVNAALFLSVVSPEFQVQK